MQCAATCRLRAAVIAGSSGARRLAGRREAALTTVAAGQPCMQDLACGNQTHPNKTNKHQQLLLGMFLGVLFTTQEAPSWPIPSAMCLLFVRTLQALSTWLLDWALLLYGLPADAP